MMQFMSKHSRRKLAAPPSAKISRSDETKAFGFLLLFFVFLTLFWYFHSVYQQDLSVSKTIEEWKTIYHITDSQAERIKQIELDFHGNGSPFAIKSNRTHDEKHRHHEEISRQMPPEDGARFMQVMEEGTGRH
jgi:hypothetical protein